MNKLRFEVPGEPRGKGRPRFARSGHVYTDDKTSDYERQIRNRYYAAHRYVTFSDDIFVSVEVVAYLPIPKRATKAQRAGMEAGDILPSRKPDADNILKIVLDALNGVAYKDDARVHKASCEKYYGAEPRLVVTISEAKEKP